jgi:hypothetical protein
VAPFTYSYADVIRAAIEERLNNLWSSLPGIIQSFDDTTQTVDVQPAVGVTFVNEQGNRVLEILPIIRSVPVMFPSGGGFSLMFQLKKGDPCVLVFASCSTDRYIAEGGLIKDPGDGRKHHLGDAFCLPGGRSLKKALKGARSSGTTGIFNQESAWLGREGGPGILIDTQAANIGGLEATNADKQIVIQSALDDFMSALQAAITAANVASVPATIDFLQTALNELNFTAGWKARTFKARAC